MRLAVCMKWVDTRPEIDPLSGDVVDDRRWFSASRADQAALEAALTIRDRATSEVEITVVCAGPPAADAMLCEALASGASRAIRIDLDPDLDAAAVAAAVAPVLSDTALVVCGDWSIDRGTGSFPAFLAHELAVAQALGCTRVALVGGAGASNVEGGTALVVEAERRLDGGRRERVRLTGRGVVSVEAGTELRRAGLRAVLTAARSPIEVVAAAVGPSPGHVLWASGPFRPRSHEIPAPADHDPRIRLMTVAGAMVEPQVSQALHLDAVAAADHLLDRLADWGIEDRSVESEAGTAGPDGDPA